MNHKDTQARTEVRSPQEATDDFMLRNAAERFCKVWADYKDYTAKVRKGHVNREEAEVNSFGKLLRTYLRPGISFQWSHGTSERSKCLEATGA